MRTLQTICSALLFAGALTLTGNQAFAQKVIYEGKFKGQSGHKTSGNITIKKTSRGHIVTLARNFSFDGAPDPRFGFGNNGRYKKSTTFSRLKSNNGRQSYLIPKSINIAKFNEFYLWCKKFGVPLGKVKLPKVGKSSSNEKFIFKGKKEDDDKRPHVYRGSFH